MRFMRVTQSINLYSANEGWGVKYPQATIFDAISLAVGISILSCVQAEIYVIEV